MTDVLLIGCGNIGFRHLQALLAMRGIENLRLTIVEPDAAQHARITAEVKDTPCDLGAALSPDRHHFDLAIISTNANIRRQVFDDLISKHEVDSVIFEKVLFQTISDIDAVGATLAERRMSGFVNCGRRGFPGYQELRERLVAERPLQLTVTGTQYALASNAIHLLDIAAYLNASPLVSVDASQLSRERHSSKRQGYVEVYGTLKGVLENGAQISLTCDPADSLLIDIHLKGADVDVKIDEAAGQMTQSDGASSQDHPFAVRHVSGMPELYSDLLTTGTCALTPYAESAQQHRLLLRAIRLHLGLSNADDATCPIS